MGILSVGLASSDKHIKNVYYDSRCSLEGADISIISCPHPDMYSTQALCDYHDHWANEIRYATDAGKNIYILLNGYTEPLISLLCAPGELSATTYEGGQMRLRATRGGLEDYWLSLGPYSVCKERLTGTDFEPILFSGDDNTTVGGIMAYADASIVLLPTIQPWSNALTCLESGHWEIDDSWKRFDRNLPPTILQSFLSLEEGINYSIPTDMPPDWALVQLNTSKTFKVLSKSIEDIEQIISQNIEHRKELQKEIAKEQDWLLLLYGSGNALECIVAEALECLGIRVQDTIRSHEQQGFNFDILGTRFVGEVEGEDDSAIDVSHFRSLQHSIESELDASNQADYAQGVLFGNPYRLLPIDERPEKFTEKCRQRAQLKGTRLVATADLYPVVEYLRHKDDDHFRQQCIAAICDTIGGIVLFPSVPVITAKDAAV